jgi:hypothetical protein
LLRLVGWQADDIRPDHDERKQDGDKAFAWIVPRWPTAHKRLA